MASYAPFFFCTCPRRISPCLSHSPIQSQPSSLILLTLFVVQPFQQFYEKYTRKRNGGRVQLKEIKRRKHGFDCIFLDRNSIPGKAVCSLYEDRPLQCRTWPFWPKNLISPEAWDEAGEECPGINQGPVRGIAEIEKALENDSRT